MSRLIVCLFVLLALLGAMPLAAQEDTYVVQKGDNLWVLEGNYSGNPSQWKRIVKLNPFLAGPGRIFQDKDRTIVLIQPGEKLVGLGELGIVPMPLSVDRLKLPRPEPVVYTVPIIPSWLWWLVGFLICAILYTLRALRTTNAKRLRESERATQEEQRRLEIERRREPEQLGTPVVPGGIQPTETERLQNFFREQAVSSYVTRHPELGRNRSAVQPTLVGQIEPGMLSGEGQVCDLNGIWHNSLIDPPGRPGYRARFRYPDGTEELMQSYQACMNPVRYGEGMRGFTFVPHTQPAAAPQPTPTAQAPAPESTPAPTVNESGEFVRPTDAPPAANGHGDLLKISFRPEEGGKDSLVQAEGVDVERFTFEKNGNSITFRFREAKTNK